MVYLLFLYYVVDYRSALFQTKSNYNGFLVYNIVCWFIYFDTFQHTKFSIPQYCFTLNIKVRIKICLGPHMGGKSELTLGTTSFTPDII